MKLGILDFFQDISNFFRGGTVLGIDIGSASIKITELMKQGERFRLANYGILETKEYLEHPNKALQTNSLAIEEKKTIELLSMLLREVKPKTKLAVMSVPIFVAFSTVLDLPLFSRSETDKIVAFQAQQHVPIPIDQAFVEWFPIEEFESRQGQKYQRVFLVAIPKEALERYKNICKGAGLKLVALEVEAFPLHRVFQNFFTDATTLVVDIGALTTNFLVIGEKKVKYIGQTEYSGVYLTQALSNNLGVSMFRAEELKRRRGLTATGADSELSTLLLPFLDVIIQEARHAKDVYERRYGKKVEKLMLAGGGANLSGVEKYFVKQIGLQLAHHSVLMDTEYPVEIEPIVKSLNNELAISLGLARRYFS